MTPGYDYATPSVRAIVIKQLISRGYDSQIQAAILAYLDHFVAASPRLSIKVRTGDKKRGVALTLQRDGRRIGYVDLEKNIKCKIASRLTPSPSFEHAEKGQVLVQRGQDGYIIYLNQTNWEALLAYTLNSIDVILCQTPKNSRAALSIETKSVSSNLAAEQSTQLPSYAQLASDGYEPNPRDPDFSAEEGDDCYRTHRAKERNKQLVTEKKRLALRDDPQLHCEVCHFSFIQKYGDWGRHFAEVHHKLPLSSRTSSVKTRLDDLAIVCSNCHSMLHRQGHRTLSIAELKQILEQTKS